MPPPVPDEPPSNWPWDRLLIFGLGCVAASIGVYVIGFHTFQTAFGINEGTLPHAYAWGTFGIILGILLLSMPWLQAGPLARRWSKFE